MLECFEVVAVAAGIDAPVDEAEVVAGGVLAVFEEVARCSAPLRPVFAGHPSLDHHLDGEAVVRQPFEVFGPEVFVLDVRHGRASGAGSFCAVQARESMMLSTRMPSPVAL